MKRIIYDQEKLQRWANNEQDAFISAGALLPSETPPPQNANTASKAAPSKSESVGVEPKRRIKVSSRR